MNRSLVLIAGVSFAAMFSGCQSAKTDTAPPQPKEVAKAKAAAGSAAAAISELINAAKGKSITGNCAPNDQYPADGLKSLVDGMTGTDDYLDPEWLGWWHEDKPFDVTIDLGKAMTIATISAHALTSTEAWIFYPKNFVFEVSTDNKTWRKLETVMPSKEDLETEDPEEQWFHCNGQGASARYVRVKAQRYGELPEWHSAHGGGDGYEGQAWLFLDEIKVMSK